MERVVTSGNEQRLRDTVTWIDRSENVMEGSRVVFIAGDGRSGGTLLGQILNGLSDSVYVGELRNIWHEAFEQNEPCGCGERFRHCEFWRAVVEKAFGSFEQLDVSAMLSMHKSLARERYTPMLMLLNRVPAELLGSELPRVYEDALSRLYRAIREVAGKSVVVDSSREVSQALILARIPGIDLRVLHLVRDSRAVAFSNSRGKPIFRSDNDASQHRKPEWISSASRKLAFDEDGATRILLRQGAVASALQWTWRNAWASGIPHSRHRRIPYTRLRYEDLVRDPREAIGGALDRLGLGRPDLSMIQGTHVQLGVNHAVSGNPVKFSSGGVDLRIDDEWREKMKGSDRKVVSVITSPLMHQYGYVI
ncbi:sulfotransferase [Candidatus Binatus sp.]|uniref:sulfotransferase n=2 Tax=Candidatus Binatus sp. TaxID=2811406 RepID=UPI003BEA5596